METNTKQSLRDDLITKQDENDIRKQGEVMAAIFIDLDGTTMFWGSNTFVPGAYEELKKFHGEGNELIFTTQRGRFTDGFPPIESYLKTLFPDCIILFDISSPRIVINDAGAGAINHPRDASWDYDFSKIAETIKHE